ncbi:hypothetical protein Pmar_PMAR019096 [Perkinsus marinus ATCC 50983]|uniref:Uncharacterized protein n=1 Tax=Perkinsus marinus (strain ATCC 50983 / TXsc) TaxID=423536 RepID=C5KTV0_PERM5|nr:hypothetical protein Pmar_PMAR019096 [Perkinsus marinus ATCC 50983]EER11992.1 hypothetical protein Pmar_PMAR019096 [Perkinsus marinus ATCC 50983]|eukprot:XP_002780197.1 hypothetical protein Pmar_PMAR019096 [Perkinsus marinus ATCC 50983]
MRIFGLFHLNLNVIASVLECIIIEYLSRTGSRNTCEVPGCGRVPRKSSDSARARFCTRHGGGRPCHYPGCQVAARGLLGFCYRHRHYANSSAYGNGVDGKAMPTPTPEATESEIRAARLENYVPVPSCVDSVELAALTYIASTLKASEAATAEGNSQGESSNTASTTAAIQDSTGSSTASPLATPVSPYSATTSQSPLLSSSQEQTLVETGTSPVTTPSGGDAMEAAFAAHSSAACDIDELFSIPTIPSPIFKPAMAAASGPLDVAPCPMDTEDESAVMGRL